MSYSLDERVELVLLFGQEGRSSRAAARRFNEIHPDRNISNKSVTALMTKFLTTGSVCDAKRSGRPKTECETAEMNVLATVSINPQQSVREISKTCSASKSTVHRVLKDNKFHPYKMTSHQELREDDFERRILFCEQITEKINDDPGYLERVCFSDESSFFLNGDVNKQNCRYWAEENPHNLIELHTQYPQKVNAWAGIVGGHIIGPIFFDENLTGNLYLKMLQEQVVPILASTTRNGFDTEGNPVIDTNGLIFQQDGAPPHYTLPVRNFLNETFPGSWIGRRGPVEWPPRSPDLTPLDFFLWGHLKSVVYRSKPANILDLKQRIRNACTEITVDILQNVAHEFHCRLYHCLAVGGAQFEHLL